MTKRLLLSATAVAGVRPPSPQATISGNNSGFWRKYPCRILGIYVTSSFSKRDDYPSF